MTSIRPQTLLVATLATLAFGLNVAADAQAATGQATKVAVVDIEKVFDEYNRRTEEERKLKVELEKIKGELASLKVELDDLVEQAKLANPGSEKRAELEQKMYETRANMELYARLQNIELEERMTEMTRALYEDIRDAVRDYALRNGYTLVLKYDSGMLQSSDPQDFRLEINSRQVLYFKQGLDITQAVLQVLNQG
jgi:Skp family chaperone for outer membrane proteins